MAKFKKAFIPLGVSGVFVALSLVGGLALTSTLQTRYIPEEIVIEDAGGEDVTTADRESFSTELKKVKVYDGDYYDGLKDSETDPTPVEGMYNSIALICEGGNSKSDRKLIVTQNEQGAFYQYIGYEHMEYANAKLEQDYLLAFSRHGMFVKFNSYQLSQPEEGQEKGELYDMYEVLGECVNKNLGKWYKVAVSKEASYHQ